MSDQLRVDRGSIQGHIDDTRSNAGNVRAAADIADSRQAAFHGQTEGGVGSEQIAQTRAATQRHGVEVNSNVDRLMNRTSENTDEFIGNVTKAAQSSLNTIS